jgi:hypothetical protein
MGLQAFINQYTEGINYYYFTKNILQTHKLKKAWELFRKNLTILGYKFFNYNT